METFALHRNARISAQKARLVADQIRGLHVNKALELLKFSTKKASELFHKVVWSAISNAEHNHAVDIDDLYITTVLVDEAQTLKRWRARAKGRGNQILKRSCHISVKVSDIDIKK